MARDTIQHDPSNPILGLVSVQRIIEHPEVEEMNEDIKFHS